jgi:hypothetical protein
MPGPKSGSKGGVAARQGGGFRSGFGNFNEEHMEQQSMAASSKQHSLTQQTSNAAQTTAGGSAIQKGGVSQESPQSQKEPREVDTIKEEGKRVVTDVISEIKGFFSLHKLLEINNEDTPEEKQKKETVLKRFNKLTDEQKQVAQEKYQKKMQKQKTDEEEKQVKKQREDQAKQTSIAPPTSPKKGAVGPAGSKKQKAAAQLQQNRQTMGKVQGAN